MKRVAFVPCLPPGIHPGMDSIAFSMAATLEAARVELELFPADLRGSHGILRGIGQRQERAVLSALAANVDAIILFVLEVNEPRSAVLEAIERGVPVVAIHRPAYPVSAALVVPNYHQGVVLGQALFQALGSAQGRRVAVVGGPEIVDDLELVRGAVDGVKDAGLTLLNDPFLSHYRNLDDVRGSGARAVERVLDDFYPFDGCVVFNDETLLDALEVFKERGLVGKFPVVSRNGSPAAIAEVRSGRSHATFDYHLPELGMLAARTALDCRQGTAMPTDALIATPVGELFTRENAHRYVDWSLRAPPRRLNVCEQTSIA